MTQTENRSGSPEYTQGVCDDGAAILKDGQRMTIDEIVAELNQAARAQQAEAEPVAYGLKSAIRNVWDGKTIVPFHEADQYDADALVPLYFAPPAPAPVVPEGYVLVPKSMNLDREAMENLLCMTGDSVAEDEFYECVLWVGETSDPDTGKKLYGLNAMLSEYPEEGSNPVILFDPPSAAPQQSEPVVPELHNIRKVERIGDQSILVTLASCRATSALERALSPKTEEVKNHE